MSGTITPVSQVGKVLLGSVRELEASLGLTGVYDTNSTLNAKYNTFPSLVPTALPTLLYFGIGIGGCFNVNGANLSEPYPVLKTNMDLYIPIPFRCVPVEQDLTSQEKVQYRMRVRKTIGGADYFLYYLKLITFNQSTVQLTQTNPTTSLQTPYTLDYSNLNPTPPTVNSSGVITSNVVEVNASVTSGLALTGAEVVEVVNVLYNGDLRFARISELGLYSGQDRVVTGVDANGNPLSYTEAVLAQLNVAYTNNGDDFSVQSRSTTYQIANGAGSLLLLGG